MTKNQSGATSDLRVQALLWLFGLVFLLVFLGLPAIPQDTGYFDFADKCPWLGISNAFNVLSNLPYFLVGYLGFSYTHAHRNDKTKFIDKSETTAFYIAFAGIFLVGLGSGWFHWAPEMSTLAADRLPMTIGFMAILAIIISERINLRAGITLLPVLLFIGILSVLFWMFTENSTSLTGDLRLYALVQFFPIVAIVLMLLWFPPRYQGARYLILILVFYGLAKLAEGLDWQIWDLTGKIISGHSLKHLLAALATYYLVLYLKKRQPA
ncbi:MAG: ceramidase domain-containing protein [Proteobacteria bacterium]|nr:ceramidase domain-containing protein [Pseudomonadota bacterium]